MKRISTPANITSLRSRKDGSLGISLETPELDDQEKVEIMHLQNVNIHAVFIPTDEPEAPEMKIKADIEAKSQSQRLRGVLFILWRKSGEKEPFETFYFKQTEKIINYLKSKIDE